MVAWKHMLGGNTKAEPILLAYTRDDIFPDRMNLFASFSKFVLNRSTVSLSFLSMESNHVMKSSLEVASSVRFHEDGTAIKVKNRFVPTGTNQTSSTEHLSRCPWKKVVRYRTSHVESS